MDGVSGMGAESSWLGLLLFGSLWWMRAGAAKLIHRKTPAWLENVGEKSCHFRTTKSGHPRHHTTADGYPSTHWSHLRPAGLAALVFIPE